MEVKHRVIQMGNRKPSSIQANCMMIDEICMEGGEIYHRNIVIDESAYNEFEKNFNDEMLLNEFLERYDIHSKWKHYTLKSPEDDWKGPSRLYHDLSGKESLINNPLIIDVFNEAIREEPDLSSWESVFPFLDNIQVFF